LSSTRPVRGLRIVRRFEHRLGALLVNARQILLHHFGVQIALRDIGFRALFIEPFLGRDALDGQRFGAAELASHELEPGALGLDAFDGAGLKLGQRDAGGLHRRVELCNLLTGLDRVAARDQDRLEHTGHGAADLDLLRRLHHAIEGRGAGGQ